MAFETMQPMANPISVNELNRQCKEGLAKMPQVKLQTLLSDKPSAGMVCFEVEGLTPSQTVERLKERGVVASTTPPYKYASGNTEPVESTRRVTGLPLGRVQLVGCRRVLCTERNRLR